MSSFGTAKVQTTNLNLGFPDPFSYWYASNGASKQYYPEGDSPAPELYAGSDSQAQWHQQKKRDADHMARAKVRSTHLMNARAFSSPNGYFGLPPPILSQRRFANPSQGALDIYSTRQDVPGLAPFSEVQNPYVSQHRTGGRLRIQEMEEEGHLHGGVLRTTVGQEWAKAKLNDRINQFNAINEAKQAFTGDMPQAPSVGSTFAGAPSLTEGMDIQPQIELATSLQQILDTASAPGFTLFATTRTVGKDLSRIFSNIVRLATTGSGDDMSSVLEYIEGGSTDAGITQQLTSLLGNYERYSSEGYTFDDEEERKDLEANLKLLKSQLLWFQRVEQYLKQMLKVVDSPAKDRASASKTLIKSLGFTRVLKENADLSAQVGNANRETLAYLSGQPPQKSGAFIAPTGKEEYPAELGDRLVDENSAYFPVSYRGVSRSNKYIAPLPQFSEGDLYDGGSEAQDFFSQQQPIREDTQMGYIGNGGVQFSSDQRGAFGDQSGRFVNTVEAPSDEGQYNTGGRPIGYAGAEALADVGMAQEGGTAEASQFALLASQTPPSLQMRSRRDATTGEYDVVPGGGAGEPPRGAPRGAPAPAPAPARRYTEDDVPRNLTDLRAFVNRLIQENPGYSQRIYNVDSRPRNVRLNTIRNMRKRGYLG